MDIHFDGISAMSDPWFPQAINYGRRRLGVEERQDPLILVGIYHGQEPIFEARAGFYHPGLRYIVTGDTE